MFAALLLNSDEHNSELALYSHGVRACVISDEHNSELALYSHGVRASVCQSVCQ
jgi:hypothetical protein